MVYYKDNKNLKNLSVVTTSRGDTEYRRNTKFINQKYYTINRDCFKVNDKWYTIDSGNILFDNEKGVYVLKKYSKLLYGIIENDNGELELGYFSSNPYNNILTSSVKFGLCNAINIDILIKNGWTEDLGNNLWYNPKEISISQSEKKRKIRNERPFTDRGYNIEDNNVDYSQKIKYYNEYPLHITPKAREMSKYLGDLTFGVEIEVQQGCIPEYIKNRYGVVICRDGSLNGGAEIVTIPLSGAKGLQTLVNLADELKNRTEIGINCSFHIHFGNLNTDKLSIISLYILSRNIQNELFTMFPYYKIDYSGVKQKNYTKKLLKLNIHTLKDKSKEAYELYLTDSWTKLFNFFAEGRINIRDFNKKTREHPIHRKWEMHNRYHYINFLNLFFGHRHTVESRLHTGTTNSHKMINWLFIVAAIIKYSQKYSYRIITSDKTVSLKEILDIYPTLFPFDKKADKISKYLYNYFLQRRDRCKKDLEKNDRISEWDINEDKSYKFEWNGIKGLI